MPPDRPSRSGWQGACLVAITYVYFLIFAQFAFLRRLANLGIADAHLKAVMAAMAIGGILLSLVAPRIRRWPSPVLRLRAGLLACAVAALLSLLRLTFAAAATESFFIGAALGLLTVTLVTHLVEWAGNRSPLFAVGAGTGLGYFLCNVPQFFTATPQVQAAVAAGLCLFGVIVTAPPIHTTVEYHRSPATAPISFFHVLSSFTALVWLDSAAFFIIQSTASLKAGTWQGTAHLWGNGLLHLAAALISAILLSRRRPGLIFAAAFVALGSACLLLNHPDQVLLASILYPVGVSLYSVALVAYPSLLAPAASVAERGRMAGWIYAIAGWFGSAMGIGMGQHLGHVPPIFVVLAGAVVFAPYLPNVFRVRYRELSLTALVLLAALGAYGFLRATTAPPQLSSIERGRQVYISEGCIHCHSQYVRPDSPDVLMWGPVQSVSAVRSERPPLIGNRRQGPDLSQVGARRSQLWLKMHFYNPAEVSGASIMPSYGFLFRGQRGNDLIAYLESLRGPGTVEHIAQENSWHPALAALVQANSARGEQLYERDCATCHGAGGRTRVAWQSSFAVPPIDFSADTPHYLRPEAALPQRLLEIARIVKFGIPGTDMAGHEYLSDSDVSSIALWLSQQIAQSHAKS